LNKRGLDWTTKNTRLILLEEQGTSNLRGNFQKLHNKHVLGVKLLGKKKLNKGSWESPATVLIRLEAESEEIQYEPGDHLAIYPQNQKDKVEFIHSTTCLVLISSCKYNVQMRETSGL